jgi:raffinose/stachyose/melibiose transport system substrate-binding protein
MKKTWTRLLVLLAVVALLAAACGDSSSDTTEGTDDTTTTAASADPVVIDWWHIENNDPGLSIWQDAADAYVAEHPNVRINITVQENEAFKTALQTNLQAGDVPDIFQSWGGGVLREQADAGLVQDVTSLASACIDQLEPGAVSIMEVDGELYGFPWDLGIVGFWYNKTLFEQAGIDAPPATWSELLDDVEALKSCRDHPDRGGRR